MTEDGSQRVEDMLKEAGIIAEGNLYDIFNVSVLHHIHQSLRAHTLFARDVDYIVRQDKVVLIRHVDLHGRSSSRVLQHAYLNSLFQTGLKNLLDRAVIDRAQETGLRDEAKLWQKADELPFDFVRRRMSVVLFKAKAEPMLFCKGAVEEMLDETKVHLRQSLELTARQREVLQLLAEGKSAKEIGAILDISPRTVETHKYKMMDDLGVKTSAELVQQAVKQGLIAP